MSSKKIPKEVLDSLEESAKALTSLEIKEFMNELDIMLGNLRKKYEDNVAIAESFRKLLRKLCKHEKTTYYPDASGNNDSCFTCDYCGLEKKRF